MDSLTEKQISREEIYNGHIVHLVKDTVLLPNGNSAIREVCLHKGAVAVLPLLDDGRVIVEKQYRYPHNRVFLEIPAGKLDSEDEDPLLAAKRELREETGAIAEKYTYLGKMIPSVAILGEVIHLYLAEGIRFGERELDEDEFLDVEFMDFDELFSLASEGKIEDAKTEITVFRAKSLLSSR